MASRSIRQTVTVQAPPHDVYETLMDARRHAKLTGGPAKISRKVGGAFSVYDGYATGTNIELVPDAKIVQTWRASDWPLGAISRVTFGLTAVPSGTRVRFTHTGVPPEFHDAIKQGWIDFYWTPLKALFNER